MKINSNLNKNYYAQQKHQTFGVRKTDSVENFIDEIRKTNQNLGDIGRLPIVKKMKENRTLEQLQEQANENRSLFGNKRSFNIANKKGFTTFINSICLKIMQELNTLGETVEKFIVQVEDENENEKESDIIRLFRQRLSVKENHKKYYKTHKDEIKEKQKKYRQNNSEKTKRI